MVTKRHYELTRGCVLDSIAAAGLTLVKSCVIVEITLANKIFQRLNHESRCEAATYDHSSQKEKAFEHWRRPVAIQRNI